MNDSLYGYSIDEINSNREFLKIVLVNYSSNVKSYAKWFEISDIDKNEESYTSYKVIYRLLPKDINESIKEIIVWKRFRDFKDLYETMQNYHVSLHRKDKFPDFPKSKFFNRFDDKVIDERKQASLRLLQFIGSQSHLYRHEKFVEFLADGKFCDYAFKNQDNNNILKPKKLEIKTESTQSYIKKLKSLNCEIENYLQNTSSDFINDYLVKTTKLIDLAIQNENSDYHLTTVKFLTNSSNILSDLENSVNDSGKLKFLKQTNSALIDIINGIHQLKDEHLNEENNTNNLSPVSESSKTQRSASNSNFLNEWILSDFNLQSDDFNNELSLILGKLFDLSFNFKLVRILNNNCFLVKYRCAQNSNTTNNNKKFVLKRLSKSYNPIITQKSIVPFGNRIPYMCQLIKYYESEDTIFLLLEYFEHGRLYTHLNYLHQDPDNFSKNVKNIRKLTRQESEETIRENSIIRRNSLSNLRLNYSLPYLKKIETPKRRTRSEINDNFTLHKLDIINNEVKLTEFKLTDEKRLNDISSASLSSSSSLSEPDKPSPDKIEFVVKPEEKKLNNKIKEFLKLKFDTKNSIVLFKSKNSDSENSGKLSKSESQSSSHDESLTGTLSSYYKQIKLWLAHLALAIKNLHKIGIILKDLNADNLLLNQNSTLVLSYFSEWNLVDMRLNNEAINNFYVAPELCGLVNYQVDEAADWWSFGVIAYEMLTLRKFSDMNSLNQIYVNNINFPEDFKFSKAIQLIKQLLKICPKERLKIEQIETHSFFANIDWIFLENSYWKSK